VREHHVHNPALEDDGSMVYLETAEHMTIGDRVVAHGGAWHGSVFEVDDSEKLRWGRVRYGLTHVGMQKI